MKNPNMLATIAAVAATFLLHGTTWAQTPGGADAQNMDQQAFENMARQAGSSPQEQQAAMELFQKMSPEQQQAAIARFQNLDPQLQQNVMQQVQNVTPQMQPNALPQFQGMDPQQMQNAMQQRINDSLRDQMGVTNDVEWLRIQEKINAVRKAQMAVLADSGMVEMMGMGGMGGGRRGGGFQAMFGRLSPESQALQQAIDSHMPAAQIQDLLAKFVAARKKQEAALAKAQDDLRSVLTIRQEAIAVLGGLLN